MKLNKNIIKALYESQVGTQAKKLNQAEQKSFFYIVCEFGLHASNLGYLQEYDKNADMQFYFSDADDLEEYSNFELTRDGELKLVIGEDFDGKPITWENLLNSDNKSSSKYTIKQGSMIGLQTFKTKKEAEDLIKNEQAEMKHCCGRELLDPEDRWRKEVSFNFKVKEYTKANFERDLERL